MSIKNRVDGDKNILLAALIIGASIIIGLLIYRNTLFELKKTTIEEQQRKENVKKAEGSAREALIEAQETECKENERKKILAFGEACQKEPLPPGCYDEEFSKVIKSITKSRDECIDAIKR